MEMSDLSRILPNGKPMERKKIIIKHLVTIYQISLCVKFVKITYYAFRLVISNI